MQLCKISDAAPGMALARPICNSEGAVLCPAGFVLTDVAIQRIENAGVEAFFIEGGEESGPTPAERIEELNRRFAGITDPLMLELKSIVENHYAAKGAARRDPA